MPEPICYQTSKEFAGDDPILDKRGVGSKPPKSGELESRPRQEDELDRIVRRLHFEETWGSLTDEELSEGMPKRCERVIARAKAAISESAEKYYLPREQVEAAIGENEDDPGRNARWQIYRNELRQEIRSKLGLNTRDKDQS